MAGVSLLPPVSREQAFLETYFQCISQFAYDKAKDLCEKEKENLKASHLSTTWSSLLNSLITLALSEKTYASLFFLGQKWFGRKDNLRSSYGMLLSDLRKIEENSIKLEAHGQAGEPTMEKILAHLCGQLCHFLTARSKTMEFYEQMSTMGNNRNMNYEDLLMVITDIIQAHQRNFHHPILGPLKTSFSLECDIINHLLQAQIEMANWQFLSSLLHLNDAHGKLASWSALVPSKEVNVSQLFCSVIPFNKQPAGHEKCVPPSCWLLTSKETKKLGFGGSKHPPIPTIYQWLIKFKGVLVSKFSLYFYEVLSKQAPSVEVKGLLSRTTVDFYGKIVSFQKRCDATNISLVFDANGIEGLRKGSGYHHPLKFLEPPKGLDSYPAIFTYPAERPERHWPSVISIINDKSAELNTFDKTVYFCDEKFQNTYFMSRIEPRVTFVVVFETKKSEKDSYVNNFMSEFCIQLRFTKLFATLKGGSK